MSEPYTNTALERMLRSLIDHEEEFREFDASAGDGDLGITVRSTATALSEWLPQSSAGSTSELLAGIAQVCASTSPSTFASLVSKALEGQQREDLSSLVVALEAGIAMIQRRGGAKPGDKTFLDALVPALEAARTATSLTQALSLMRIAAIAGTEQMVPAIPQHGRAAWVGERARGVPDAGSVVVIRALEALDGTSGQPWHGNTARQ